MPRTKKRGVPNLGERIRQLMEALQLEASELSARTGISESYLSRIIRGEVPNPTIDFVIRIAAGLGVTETQLLRPELRRESGSVRFGGGYPVADAPEERQPHEYESKLQELLQEIEEISQRIEEVRRTVKQLLQTGEQ